MTASLISAAFLVGMPLRRMFGGWLGLSRSVCTVLIISASAAPFWWRWGGFADVHVVGPLHLPEWALALTATALVAAHWTDGHRFDRPWLLLGRYGWVPLLLALATKVWPVASVGPLVTLSAVACRWWAARVILPFDHDPEMVMLDGWEGWWEMALGGVSMAAFWAAALV